MKSFKEYFNTMNNYKKEELMISEIVTQKQIKIRWLLSFDEIHYIVIFPTAESETSVFSLEMKNRLEAYNLMILLGYMVDTDM